MHSKTIDIPEPPVEYKAKEIMNEKCVYQKPVFLRLRRLTLLLELRNNASDQTTRDDLLDAALTACQELLEGVANVLIWSVPNMDEDLRDGIERLDVAQKFNLLHLFKTLQSMDPGHHTVQGLRSLIKNRVALIHPKPVNSGFKSMNYESGIGVFEPKKRLLRSTEEDIKLVKNVFNFLDVYLIDWCKVNMNTIYRLLLADEIYFYNGTVATIEQEELDTLHTKLKSLLNIEIRFISSLAKRV